MTGTGMAALRIRVHGRVQGVSYRAFVASKAEALGLYGFVRNRLDGTVEAVFSGEAATVETMLEACRAGPPLARVDRIEQTPATGILPERFEIKPTV